MNKSLFLAPIAVVVLTVPAFAQTIPRYNVEGYCQQVAEISGGSAMIFKGYMDMEQQAYNSLKPVRAQNLRGILSKAGFSRSITCE